MITKETLLHQPIGALPLSDRFRNIAGREGWQTLADVQQFRTGELLALPGFSEHLLYEYIDLLEANGLGGLIDP